MFNQSIYIFDLILKTQMVSYFEQKGGGFLLVYSVTDPKSFENIRKIYDKILSHSPNDFGWKQSRFGFLEKSD
jgi:hypothetical protein